MKKLIKNIILNFQKITSNRNNPAYYQNDKQIQDFKSCITKLDNNINRRICEKQYLNIETKLFHTRT